MDDEWAKACIDCADYQLLCKEYQNPNGLFTPEELLYGHSLFAAITGKGCVGKSKVIEEIQKLRPDIGFLPLAKERALRPGEEAGREIIPTSRTVFDRSVSSSENGLWMVSCQGVKGSPRYERIAFSVGAIKRAIQSRRPHLFIPKYPMYFGLKSAFPGTKAYVIVAPEVDYARYKLERGLAPDDGAGMNDYGLMASDFEDPTAVRITNAAGGAKFAAKQILDDWLG